MAGYDTNVKKDLLSELLSGRNGSTGVRFSIVMQDFPPTVFVMECAGMTARQYKRRRVAALQKTTGVGRNACGSAELLDRGGTPHWGFRPIRWQHTAICHPPSGWWI